jgi:hypothetical protein
MKIVDDKRIRFDVNTFYYDKFCENILFEIEVGPIRTKIKFAIEIITLSPQNEILSNSFLCFWIPKRDDGHTTIHCVSILSSLFLRNRSIMCRYFRPCDHAFHSVSVISSIVL